MRPVGIPAHVDPEIERVVIGGEDGTIPAEYLVTEEDGVRSFTCLVELGENDMDALVESRLVWLTLHGFEVPWTLAIAELADDPVASTG